MGHTLKRQSTQKEFRQTGVLTVFLCLDKVKSAFMKLINVYLPQAVEFK